MEKNFAQQPEGIDLMNIELDDEEVQPQMEAETVAENREGSLSDNNIDNSEWTAATKKTKFRKHRDEVMIMEKKFSSRDSIMKYIVRKKFKILFEGQMPRQNTRNAPKQTTAPVTKYAAIHIPDTCFKEGYLPTDIVQQLDSTLFKYGNDKYIRIPNGRSQAEIVNRIETKRN